MIAERNHISITYVQHYFDSFANIPKFPKSIGINELLSKMTKHSNSSYLYVIVDNKNRFLFEVLLPRSKG